MARLNGGQIIADYLIQEKVPYLIDANIGADMNPGGAGVWELPGLGPKRPAIGGGHVVDA